MEINDYQTAGGKNLITAYIDKLSKPENWNYMTFAMRSENQGWMLLKSDTRQLRGKLWEIRASQTRVMYVIIDKDGVAFLHICKKQKGKAEKQELEKAIKRAKNERLL